MGRKRFLEYNEIMKGWCKLGLKCDFKYVFPIKVNLHFYIFLS